ncbi:hypothetical protein C7S16_5899 [Burkholderia thailandensis]|uniref:Uncharacterized protein n=1 Tax=Burkholderia thailandensis TaxID=57975 RepID=A0AAW9CQL6_BURTH|nr:hypothetical protein [Burkholderia thailandensis]MDW9252915.1 hypothetical protein [Burkholderia thailandensis]
MRKPSIGSPERESRRRRSSGGESQGGKRTRGARAYRIEIDCAVCRDVDLL